MEKKIYSRPTCKVVVLDTDDLICTSVTETDGQNNPFSMGDRASSSRANNRNNIWGDE